MIKVDQLRGLEIQGLKFLKEINRGSFGVVYEAISIKNSKKYAVKVQSNTTKNPQLNFQFDIYNYLSSFLKNFQFPKIYFPQIYGIFSNNHYTFMAIELLGKNLYQFSKEKIFKEENSIIDIKKMYNCAAKMLIIIHILHSANIVYRDIKPDNFLLRLDQPNSLVLVDFGLCKKEADKKQRQKHGSNRNVIGTSRYASINSHEGKQVTKADDVESLCYVLIYLVKGRLPWQGIKKKSQGEKNSQVLKMKKSISVQQLCQGLPQNIHNIVSYIRNLPKGQKIDYNLLLECIKNASQEHLGLEKTQVFLPKQEEVQRNTPMKMKKELSAEKSSQGSSINASHSARKGQKATTKKPLVKRQFLIKEDPNDQISQSYQSDNDQHPSKFAIQ